MRDIRGDLQDRAGLLEEQINAHEAQFDKLIEQLKREHDARLEDLKAELEAVNRLMEVELRRLDDCARRAEGAGAASPRSTMPSHQAPQHVAHQPAAGTACLSIGSQHPSSIQTRSCRSPTSWCAS